MSIDGLIEGSTAPMRYSPLVSARCRMSFWFVATIRRRIGRPIWRAMEPAKMSPKLPVGTQKSVGRMPSDAVAVK